jgi:hypothetical protein
VVGPPISQKAVAWVMLDAARMRTIQARWALRGACSMMLALGACGSGTLAPDGGSPGTGGAGGAAACQMALAVDRSCAIASDCVAVSHTSNCCGTAQVIGIRASEQARFQPLEAQCDATYPACGCATGPSTTDDGSRLAFDGTAGVTCVQGKCTTFVPDCGSPCPAGTTCFSCSNHASLFAACTVACAGNSDCHDPALPLCQNGSSGNTYGMYCTAAGVACDTK